MTLSKFLNPKNDVAFKKVFGTEKNKHILIRFINDMLELKGDSQIINVEFLSPVQDPEIAAKKTSIVDVLCKDSNGIQYIIEMQVSPQEGFEKRAQYYASKAYARQLDKSNKEYSSLKEVIFIAIADYIIFPDKKEYKSDHIILDKKTHEHNLKDLYFTFLELPKFTKTKSEKPNTSIEQWCRFFKYADETTERELEEIIASDKVIKCAYEEINQFNWTENELLNYDQELKRERDYIAVQKYAQKHAEEIARREGMEKGIKEGKIEIARKMLKKGLDIDDIIDMTGLTKYEINALK